MSDSNEFECVNNFSDLNRLTYSNGEYIKNTALFVDIRDSSGFLSSNDRRVVARLYRSYISEIVMILRSNKCCNEINIVGDCVSAVFTEDNNLTKNDYSGDRSDIIEALESASMINPMIDIINHFFEKKYSSYSPIKVGIGIASGTSLIVKAGESGSGISKPIFLGNNINLASHLCDKANTGDFPIILVNDMVKNHSNNYVASSKEKNKTFSDWLDPVMDIDNNDCYGASFYRISINDKLYELKKI